MSMRLGSISSTRGRLRAIILAVVVMAASAVALPQASAAPPGNDAFLSAQPLTGLPADATGSNVDATREPGEPDHAGNAGGASIWYSWTPSASGRISIDTCFSEFDTLLAVYTGSALAGLVPVAAADDTCGTRSEVTFTATEGTTYRIAVDGYAGASGVSRLRIVNPIANDDFAAAQVLTGSLPIQVAATNVGTTKEPGEPAHGGNAGGSSIWYSWTATATGPVVIDACGSTFWAQVGVYTGQAVDSLTSAVGADERCDENQGSRLVRLAAVAGTTYRIAVDGLNGATGDIKLRIQNAPANDQFATAQQLSGTLPIDVTGSNFGATGEPGEPVHAGASGSHSIWYSWTAVGSGPVTVSTCGSDFDTVLGVYTGTVVTDLGLVAANNNGCGTRSTVTFNASSGKTYRIAVDGIPGAQGSTATGIVRLIVRTPNLPPNDDFGTSQTLVGTLPISVTGTNIDATSQPGEPAHAGADGGASVWYSWTAAASGRVTMSTCLSTFNTLLGVYTGSAVGALTAVASNDDACGTGSTVHFVAAAGTTYRIAVAGYQGATGRIQLQLVTAPANDDFDAAQVIDGSLPVSATGTNVGATAEAGEPDDLGGGRATVWYSWTATTSGSVTISSCASTFSTKLGVYTGTAVTALTVVPVHDVRCTNRAKVSFAATVGTTYRIVLDGAAYSDGSPMTGSVGLSIRTSTPPPNDDLTGAEALARSLPVAATGTTADATTEHGEPLGGPSVWYSWTPASGGTVIVSTCAGSGADTRLGVYTGSAIGNLTEVPGEDRRCGGAFGGSRTITAVAGTTYRIGVTGEPPNEFGSLTLTIRSLAHPANDAFANAQVLTEPLPLATTGSNTDATMEPGEPSGSQSVWYSWTATATGPVGIDTCASGPTGDTSLAVFTGTAVDALTEIAGNGDSCGELSRVAFTATAGTTYRIRVSGPVGSFRLRIRVPNPPSNDNLADAKVLTGSLPVTTTGTNVEASRETGEPVHASGRSYASVWYSWTAGSTGRVLIDTCDSDFDTVLGVYTGATMSALGEVASNDNGCGTAAAGSKVTFAATAGTTYRIAVDGSASYGGASPEGSVALTIRSVERPANDNEADAQVLGATLPVGVAGTNVGATKESAEYHHAGNPGGASVWYRWTPAAGGPVTIDTCGATFRTLLAVYVVRPDGALGVVSANRNACGQGSRDTYTATAGANYLVVVDGADGAQGTFTLRLRPANTPANDNFANPTEVTGALPVTATGTNLEATRESSEPWHAGANGGASVWFAWTAVAAGPVSIDTCGSDFDTVLGVYTGSAVDALTTVASDDNGCGSRSIVRFTAAAGTTYRIAVDGPIRNTGSIRLLIRTPERPANDDFADAQPLTAALPIDVTGSTVDGTRESSEPFHGGFQGGASIWYRWAAGTTGKVVVETCGSGFDTLLGVYTGFEVGDLSTVAINGDACGLQSRVEFTALAGTTYRIAVDGASGAAGPVRLTVRQPHRPPNDAFAAAQQLSGTLPLAATGSNVDATREDGEPMHAGYSDGASVWYSWTPATTRRVTMDTCSGGFNTMLGVYTGSAVSALTTVASDNDGCGRAWGGSKVAFTAVAGTTYLIAVDGYTSGASGALPGTGPIDLRVSAPEPPANDDLAAARVLSGSLPVASTGTNAGATREPGEPFHAGFVGGTSVWYSWTPTLSGRVSIDTCGSSFDTLLAVYTGTAPGALSRVAGNNNGCGLASKVTFTAAAGTTYRIAVDGREAATGTISLALVDLEPRAATVTRLVGTPSPSSYGQPVTFTATVSGGPTIPTGTVQFVLDGKELGASRPLTDGKAAVTVPSLAVGSHTMTALYSGDAGHAPSSGTTAQRVDRMATRLVAHPALLEVLPLRITLRLSATLTDAAGHPIAGQPVRFEVSGRTVCTAITAADGRASCASTGAWLLAVLRLGYDAYYDGNATAQPSRGHGGVLG